MQRIKAAVALMLALVWLPAVLCCSIDASGLFGQPDCCPQENSASEPGPVRCDQPCGALASADYFPQPSQLIFIAPIGVPLFDGAEDWIALQNRAGLGGDLPATTPPELAGHWQFSFRTALPPRAPSSVL